jgi:malonyl-CoA/methylmalonyl-CoA synthetase
MVSCDYSHGRTLQVSALDVERALLEHPLVEEAVVLGVDDEVWGEKIGAIVVLSAEAASMPSAVPQAAILEWMESEVASYKVPRVWLVQDEIPKNAMGKVMKKTLKSLFD